MARRGKGRSISGVLLLNKRAGMSSNSALQQAKRLFFANKAGHTGSLDPLATGVLPICFGEATKFSQHLLDADKRYRTLIRLGEITATGDAEGEIIAVNATESISLSAVKLAVEKFVGDIEQIPPMYSALKHQGQPLYKLAREGKEIERQPRRITIFKAEVLQFTPGSEATFELDVHCSKGTYIRTLAEDIGLELGVGAHVAALHRSQSGPFEESKAISLDELSEERGEGLAELLDHHLLPVDAPVASLPELQLSEHSEFYFCQGQSVMEPSIYQLGDTGELIRIFSDQNEFLGLGEITDDGRIAPKRLVVRS